jgi:hypothetical protein
MVPKIKLRTALDVLALNPDYSREDLVRQYRLESLKHHPDKNNNTPESTARFQQINEAYCLLLKHIIGGDGGDDGVSESTHSNGSFSYMNIFTYFVRAKFNNNAGIEEALLHIISNNYTKLLDKLDKATAVQIYEFMHEYADILYLRSEDLERMRAIVVEKMKADNIIFLNPTLQDLLDKKIYKLEYEGQTFLVPLWHNEIYYALDNNTERELVVKCVIEDLPEHIFIDEHNNMTINVRTSVQRALDVGEISVSVPSTGSTMSTGSLDFKVPAASLAIMRGAQTYLCPVTVITGIPQINTRQILDASRFARVEVCIELY